MTFDPYTNRIPNGLLTDEEKAALEATGGPWEYCDPQDISWESTDSPSWLEGLIYRAVRRPSPVAQEGDVWVGEKSSRGKHWLPAEQDDPARAIIASGYRLFREVKA